jgi:hypothetical protein
VPRSPPTLPPPAPQQKPKPLFQGDPFVVGLAYWPGGLQADWGTEGASSDPSDPTATATATFLHPCNATHRAALAAAGAHFATFSARADRLAALKTTFPEELFLTGANPNATAPRVISVVAFRCVAQAADAERATAARRAPPNLTLPRNEKKNARKKTPKGTRSGPSRVTSPALILK